MSDSSAWLDANNQYLADRLAALRARLQSRIAARTSPLLPAEPVTEPEEGRSFWRRMLRKEPPQLAGKSPPLLAAGSEGAREAIAAAERPGAPAMPPPALRILAQRLGLTPFEEDVLLLCAATELDTGIAGMCAQVQDDPSRPYPTFALAFTVFDDPSWDAMSPERPLRYWRLIELHQPGGQPLSTSALRADERIVNYLKGLNYLDDRLAPLLAPADLDEWTGEIPASQQAIVDAIVAQLRDARERPPLPIVQLLGTDPVSKQLVARHVGSALGLRVHRLAAHLLSAHAAEIESIARLWERESALLPVALYVDTQVSEEGSSAAQNAAVHRLLARTSGVTFFDTRDVSSMLTQPTMAVDVAKPTAAEQRAAWSAALGASAGDAPSLLAGQFNLNAASIRDIAARAIVRSASDAAALRESLWAECLANTRPRLDAMAQRLVPRATWDDIVLPAAELRLLKQIGDQVGQRATVYQDWGFGDKMSRGLGISALFAGESGTGKTMAAEVLANHLRLNLYRIDLSAVVSKYIGETEKNLRRLFDAAEDGGAILFFDEADALFGKRSEVKDSHDRYANIEINYLLQRMESYRGLAILATNMKSALDDAFVRRLRFIVSFTFPAAAERKAIWQRVFPARTPLLGLDYDRLARLPLAGGNIHNIALNAAFLAAQSGGQVTMPIVLEAARNEFRKLERPVNEADFRWQSSSGAVA